MSKLLFAPALALSLAVVTPLAHGQTPPTPRSRAFVVNVGPMIGIMGGGLYVRINPELQFHRESRYGGHALGLGIAFVPWPNEGGPSFAFAPRYQFDHQLVPGTPFFVSPFVGLDVGLGVFNVFNGNEPRFRFVLAPSAGVDVKILLGQRMVLGFRPIGVTVPMFWGGPSIVTADVIYDIALTIGFTF